MRRILGSATGVAATLLIADLAIEGERVVQPYWTIAVVVVVIGTVALLVTSNSVRSRFSGFRPGISVTFLFQTHHAFDLVVRRKGLSLKSASLRVVAPENFGEHFCRETKGGEIAPGVRERLPESGEVAWSETGLEIPGGDFPQPFQFSAHLVPGDHPLRVAIADDDLGRKQVELVGTLTVPATESYVQNQEAQRKFLVQRAQETLLELDVNRRAFSGSLGCGYWTPASRQELSNSGFRPLLDPLVGEEVAKEARRANEDADRLRNAYVQKVRLTKSAERMRLRNEAKAKGEKPPQGDPKVRVRLDPADGMESVLASILLARIRLAHALEKAGV